MATPDKEQSGVQQTQPSSSQTTSSVSSSPAKVPGTNMTEEELIHLKPNWRGLDLKRVSYLCYDDRHETCPVDNVNTNMSINEEPRGTRCICPCHLEPDGWMYAEAAKLRKERDEESRRRRGHTSSTEARQRG